MRYRYRIIIAFALLLLAIEPTVAHIIIHDDHRVMAWEGFKCWQFFIRTLAAAFFCRNFLYFGSLNPTKWKKLI